jgi:hypothetical protein
MTLRCRCGETYEAVDDLPGRRLLSLFFHLIDGVELTGRGWTRDGRVWRCRFCTRRARLMRAVEAPAPEKKPDPESL